MAKESIIDNKTAFISALITEMTRLDLDGIEIDLEGPQIIDTDQGTAFISFMTDLKAAMPTGKELTVATFASQWHTPGTQHWSQLLPLVDALTSMGYGEIGINGSGDLSYAQQKSLASAAPEKFMLGMPSDLGLWLTNTAQEQVDWVKDDGELGMAIWDLRLPHSSWNTDEIWASINTIRGDVAVADDYPWLLFIPGMTTTRNKL